MTRRRADLVLVARGLFPTRARAQAAIAAGLVTADGIVVAKASDLVAEAAAIAAQEPHPYVSRGGVKLAAALDAFAIDPQGRICLDLGASTGGFSDCLLRRGAARVYAVDVGHGQLAPRLLSDPRLVALERTDCRILDRARVPEPIALLAVDLSFISLKLALDAALALLAPAARLVLLVKPQFEAGRAAARQGKGVIRDPAIHARVLAELVAAIGERGFAAMGTMPSPISGGDGNREFLAAFEDRRPHG